MHCCFAEDLVWFPAPTWCLTAIHNSSFWGDTFFWPPKAPGTDKTFTYKIKITKGLKKLKRPGDGGIYH